MFCILLDKVFFHKFFREKAHRDSVKGIPSKKKEQQQQQQQGARRGGGDGMEDEFEVDPAADEGMMDYDMGEDPEEEVCGSCMIYIYLCCGKE